MKVVTKFFCLPWSSYRPAFQRWQAIEPPLRLPKKRAV